MSLYVPAVRMPPLNRTFEAPAVVGSGKAPPGTGGVSQPDDDNDPVCCLQRGVVEAVTAEDSQSMECHEWTMHRRG